MNFLFSSSEMNCTIVQNGYAETLVSAKLPAWALVVRYVRKFTFTYQDPTSRYEGTETMWLLYEVHPITSSQPTQRLPGTMITRTVISKWNR